MLDDDDTSRVWDEHEWERFLQQQDRRAEQYIELMDRFIDHPERDRIVAEEMGWVHLLNEPEEFDEEPLEHPSLELLAFAETADEDRDLREFQDGEDLQEEDEACEVHPLYQAAFALSIWSDQTIESLGDIAISHPSAVRLSVCHSLLSAKLAVALSDDWGDEIGMTIAYLKRGLRAAHTSLDTVNELHAAGIFGETLRDEYVGRIFQVRDGIIELMGLFRAESRRRFGA